MMTDRTKAIKKLYEDAVLLHKIHNGEKIRKDREDEIWEDADLIE